MTDLFINDINEYKRQLDPVTGYIDQMAFYVSKMKGISVTDAKVQVKEKNRPVMKNPTVLYYGRDDTKDTKLKSIGLKGYIDDTVTKGELLAPTFTTYIPPEQEESLLVGFLQQNVKQRSISKKAAFKAKSDGNMELFNIKNNEQGNYKLYNNSMSGTFCANGTVLLNPTAHSTLTSTVRLMTSISNASNEKILEGNRHYYNSEVTLCNVIYLASLATDELASIMSKYNIHYPSVEETMDCIKYSTALYWNNKGMDAITAFVSKLSPLERTTVVYLSDLHHLRKHNDGLLRTFIQKLSSKVVSTETDKDKMMVYIDNNDELMMSLSHVICMDEVKGKGLDHHGMDLHTLQSLYGTILNVEDTLREYDDFLRAFLTVNSIPNNISNIKTMIRRAVVLSDTDSTVFSTDTWVKWFFGELDFTAKGFAVANSLGFLAVMVIKHSIRILSANIGISPDKKDILSMKPEFNFPVFAQALVSKHYFTKINIQEGNVWDKPVIEIKGAQLKASMSPKDITASIHSRMSDILNTVTSGKKIRLTDEIEYLKSLETQIRDKLLSGDDAYFSLSKVKSPEAYSDPNPARTPYIQHLLWEEVFKDKYGTIDNVPYSCIKIPTTLSNKTKVKGWLESITDRELATRLQSWLIKYGKTTLPTIYVNVDHIRAFGVPEEIIPIINTNKIILEITRPQRMVLEVLGYFVKPNQTESSYEK